MSIVAPPTTLPALPLGGRRYWLPSRDEICSPCISAPSCSQYTRSPPRIRSDRSHSIRHRSTWQYRPAARSLRNHVHTPHSCQLVLQALCCPWLHRVRQRQRNCCGANQAGSDRCALDVFISGDLQIASLAVH